MATDIKEIGDIVKKCKILLLDIEGTTTSISFVKDKLFPYAEQNVKSFLESQWETNEIKEAVAALRKLALEDEKKNLEGVVVIPGEDASKEEQIEGLLKNVKWQMSSDRKAGPLKHLQGLIWKQAFDIGEIKGHVYEDVPAALEQWHGVEGQKIYIYSSGSVQAQKLLFEKSLAGDLLPYIDGHFDTSIGQKQEIESYTSIVEKIGCKADEILFLTDIVKEAEAARSAGINSALVSREGNAPLTKEATDSFTVIHSFAQLSVSNKRKTDPQDEQPAKIPKTDNSNVVTNSDVKTSQNKAKEVPEEMEVEDENALPKEGNTEEKIVTEEPTVVVEDITDSNPSNVPVSSVEPIVTEISEKQETEPMETDTIEAVESAKSKTEQENASEHAKTDTSDKVVVEKNIEKEAVDVAKQNLEETLVDKKVPIAEETAPDVITEIEEITGDKENLIELGNIVEDIEPVEEPTSEILEELQNAGKELEKECVDILNKVQTVTNLDNIPLKQQLNPIIEESMESDNEPVQSEAVLQKEPEITQSIETADSDKLNSKIKKEKVKIEKEKAEAAGIAQDISASEKDNTESVGDKTECMKKNNEIDKEKIESVEDKSKCAMDTLETPENKTEVSEQKPESKDDSKSDQNLKTDIEKNESTKDNMELDQPIMESSDDKMEFTKNNKESYTEVSEPTKEKQEADKEKIEITKENGGDIEHLEETSSSVAITTEEKVEEHKVKQEETSVRPATESSSKDIEAMDTDKTEKPTTESTDIPKEEKVEDKTKTKEDKKDEDKQMESSDNSQVNGTTNGETEAVTRNGDASNDDLSSRLSVENSKEVNGSNRDSMDVENGPGDGKDDKKDADIKVKTVSTDEPRTEPVEQPTEA